MSDITMKLERWDRPTRKRVTFPTIRVAAGPDMLRFASLSPGESLVIGRDEECDISLRDGSISRHHARVTCERSGRVIVKDLGSTNGIAINGTPTLHAALHPGDHLELGMVSLRLELLGLEELAHLNRVVERLKKADRDPLTGLLTRAYVEEELPDLVGGCEERLAPISVMFLDLDEFKAVNDRFGHLVGDEVLTTSARLMMLGVRDTDPCVRYGGEEFLVFLPGADASSAMATAERMRIAIRGHDWERTALGLCVTSSIGVAERRTDEPVSTWLERADQALYAAKEGGRDRVVKSD